MFEDLTQYDPGEHRCPPRELGTGWIALAIVAVVALTGAILA